MQRNAAYFVLRAGNSGLALAWGFLITFIFIRVLGIGEYARYVVITAMAIYLSAADLGISNILYAHVHAAFLKGEQSKHSPFVLGAIGIYLGFAVLGTLGFSIFVFAWNGPQLSDWPKCFYFLFGVLNLPWLLVRSVNWAIERHFFFESVDFVRRTSQIAIAALLLFGVRLSFVMIGLDVIWVVAFAVVTSGLPRRLAMGASVPWPGARAVASGFLQRYGQDVRASMGFTLLEFLIYNFPYVFIPVLYGPGAALVTFDVFYKFLRGGIVASQAMSTGFLQPQTRAFHERRGRDLIGWSLLILGASLLISASVAVAVLLGGHGFFALLLNRAIALGPQLSWAIAIALVANSVQNTAGSLVVYTGHIRVGVRVAAVVAFGMACYAVLAVAAHVPVQDFILGYALVYALGAMLWAGWATHFMAGRAGLMAAQSGGAV